MTAPRAGTGAPGRNKDHYVYGCHRTTSSRPTRRARRSPRSRSPPPRRCSPPPARAARRSPAKLNSTAVSGRTATTVAKYLKISPASGTKNADPSNGITVTAVSGGKISAVTVKTTERRSGHRHAQRERHELAQHLRAAHRAVLHGDRHRDGRSGHPVTATSTFTTLTPSTAFHAEIFEGAGATYGVGMPIMLTFDHPITNKAAVERALTLTTSKPVVGAWYWDGNEQLDFRPRDYWPADTTVSFSSHLDGVEGAPGVYGVHDLSQTFNIGQSVIAVANTSTFHTQIYVGGKLNYTWPISTGKPSRRPERHVPDRREGQPGPHDRRHEGHPRLLQRAGQLGGQVHLQRRLLPLGTVVGRQPGGSNVSHGCVNLAPADAQLYYNMAVPGDPITVTSSSKAGKWDNGWTEWFWSWSQYLAGSATHMAVEAARAAARS